MKRAYFFLVFLILMLNSCKSIDTGSNPDNLCTTSTVLTVKGTSMEPLIKQGENITNYPDYYICNDVERNDIVLYRFAGNKNLILKRVKAIPGDKFELKGELILINNKPLKNSEGKLYNISQKMLQNYANSYPVIPKDTYLLLGEKAYGSLDSSHFGLVSKKDLRGKVEMNIKK